MNNYTPPRRSIADIKAQAEFAMLHVSTKTTIVPAELLLKLLTAFDARGELLAAIDDYYGVGFTRGESTPEVQRITDARAKHAAALRELEGE